MCYPFNYQQTTRSTIVISNFTIKDVNGPPLRELASILCVITLVQRSEIKGEPIWFHGKTIFLPEGTIDTDMPGTQAAGTFNRNKKAGSRESVLWSVEYGRNSH